MLNLIPLPWRLALLGLIIVAVAAGALVYVDGVRADARQAGMIEERSVWLELQRKAADQAERDRQAAQEKIDAAESARLAAEARHAIALADLETALKEQEKADVDQADCNCPPAIPRGVRDALDAIGRGPR